MFDIFLHSITQELFPSVFKIMSVIFPIVMPFLLLYVFFVLRFRWIQMRFVESQKTCLLEIKLPKEITKSPAVMEIFFNCLSQSGAGGYAEAYLDGKTRPWFSCELVSTGGEVHFYIWCSQSKFKNIVEAQLYAQYPNIEIFEVSKDYTSFFDFDLKKYSMYALQYTLVKADPFPIKTYIDYGLDKDQKDEYKIDPMTAVLEYLGSLKNGENAWIQIMVRKHEKEGSKHGKFFRPGKDLKAETKVEIENIRKSTMQESAEGDAKFKFPNPTKGQMEVISAIERSATKMPFDCMIRSVYIAETASFTPVNIGGIIANFRQYNSNNLNGFKPVVTTDVSDTFKDFARVFPFLKRFIASEIYDLKKDLFHAYKLRSYFEWPYKNYESKPFVLTAEELATIFHFPGSIVSQTPTLKRVASKKSEAPANLPI